MVVVLKFVFVFVFVFVFLSFFLSFLSSVFVLQDLYIHVGWPLYRKYGHAFEVRLLLQKVLNVVSFLF